MKIDTNVLKSLRKSKGLSQGGMAIKLKKYEVSLGSYQSYEQGRREPSEQTVIALCEILNTSIDVLCPLQIKIRNEFDTIQDQLLLQSGLMPNFINFVLQAGYKLEGSLLTEDNSFIPKQENGKFVKNDVKESCGVNCYTKNDNLFINTKPYEEWLKIQDEAIKYLQFLIEREK